MELSEDELVFAILNESHKIACQALLGPILEAVKTRNPDDWMKKICQGFTSSTRPHLERCLENNQPLKDVYLVCKLIKCNINDIANFHGGRIANPKEKERLSLNCQGIAAARNWIFHGDSISPREVYVSASLLYWVLRVLECDAIFLQTLTKVLQYAEKVLRVATFSKTRSQESFVFSSDTIFRVILYSGLKSFEKLFADLFNSVNERSSSIARQGDYSRPDNVSSLMKRIKKELCKPKSAADSLWVTAQHSSSKEINTHKLVESLQNIQAGRNKLAHGGVLSQVDVKDALLDIAQILFAFGLSKKVTESGLERLSLLSGNGRECRCFLRKMNQKGYEETRVESDKTQRMRILRPKCLHFVGRGKELEIITTSLANPNRTKPCSRMILIYGPAGIGKSYLAMKAVSGLGTTFLKQAWLCSSTEQELREDLLINQHAFSNCLNHSISDKSISSQGGQFGLLVVYDDVTSRTVDLVYQRCKESVCSAIITTRSTSVKDVLEGRTLTSLTIINLPSFTESESWQLISMKMAQAAANTQASILAKTVVTNVLGNLPLCVEIYSSLLAMLSKATEVLRLSKIDSSSLMLNWNKIEEEFGDRFHVRGLTGVVESSEAYLRDSPLQVLLLAKICVADNKYVPWEVVRMKSTNHFQNDLLEDVSKQSAEVLSDLLGVTDYLFSESGQKTLEVCRSSLEEMGLISWNAKASCVHVHQLTLKALQDLLVKKCFYFLTLIAAILEKPMESEEVISTSKFAYTIINTELLLQVLNKGMSILQRSCLDRHRWCRKDREDENSYLVFTFLSQVVRNVNIFKVLGSLEKTKIRSELVSVLFEFCFELEPLLKTTPDLVSRYTELVEWKEIYKETLRKDNLILKILTLSASSIQVVTWLNKGDYTQAILRLKKVLIDLEFLSGANSYEVASFHCLVAKLLGHKGNRLQSMYLLEASRTCPKLVTEPTVEIIRRVIENVKMSSLMDHLMITYKPEQEIKLDFWFMLIETLFQTDDTLFTAYTTGCATKECASELINLIHLLQEQCLKKIEQQTTKGYSSIVKQIFHVRSLTKYVWYEQDLQRIVQGRYTGHPLKLMLQAYNIIEETVVPCIASLCIEDERLLYGFLMTFRGLIEFCSLVAQRVGHFPLVRDISNRIEVSVDKLQAATCQKAEMSGQGSSPFLHNEWPFSFKRTKYIFDGLFLLYTKGDLPSALAKFSSVIKLLLTETRFIGDVFCGAVSNVPFQHFVDVCTVLGEKESDPLVEELCRMFKPQLQRTWKECSSGDPFENDFQEQSLYKHYIETKVAFETGDLCTAKMASLRCWKSLVMAKNALAKIGGAVLTLTHASSFTTYEGRPENTVFVSMYLRLTGYLKNIYSEEGKHLAAEWFLKFQVQCSKNHKLSFLAALYRVEYVEFLQERERWSEALEQCRLVDLGLQKHFGSDYLKWLPGAPNVTLLYQLLSNKLQQTTDKPSIPK